MSAQPAPDRRKTRGFAISVVRDPVVATDLATWCLRTIRLVRSNFRLISALAAVPALVGAAYQILLDAIRPDPLQIRQNLVAAAVTAPGGIVSPWAVFIIKFGGLIPVMVGFIVVSMVLGAFFQGGAYCVMLRRSNGQPVDLSIAVRAAAPRVGACVGWVAASLAVLAVVEVAVMMPAMTTNNPWLGVVCPSLALVVLGTYLVVVVGPFTGAIFVERRGFPRCLQLIRKRLWGTVLRTAVTVTIWVAYTLVITGVINVLLAPFGGKHSHSHLALAVAHRFNAALTIPLLVILAAMTLVTYAELRFHDDRNTRAQTLAAEYSQLR